MLKAESSRAEADSIVGTDSVSSHISVVSVAPLIAEALAKRGAKR